MEQEHKDKVVRQLIEASDQGAFLDNEPLAETLQQVPTPRKCGSIEHSTP